MMNWKKFCVCAFTCLFAATLFGCDESDGVGELKYSTGINAGGNYDRTLFYRNDLTREMADPGMIYIDEGPESGYFYIYPTGCPVRAFRTRDFSSFEFQGQAFVPDDKAWSNDNYWAPEVIYNKTDGLYYMYYTAQKKGPRPENSASTWDNMTFGVAVSKSPSGPFKEWTGTRRLELYDGNGDKILDGDGNPATEEVPLGVSEAPFDFTVARPFKEYAADHAGINEFAVIDPSPFYDENGDLYIYFVKHLSSNQGHMNIWGIKMNDPVTPDYSTLRQLTKAGYTEVNDNVPAQSEPNCTINEAPYMSVHTTKRPDGSEIKKYYLTFAIYGYSHASYAVSTAVGDSPLGPFRKLDTAFNQPMYGADGNFAGYLSGTAHHAFATDANGQMWIASHAHKIYGNGSRRALLFDRAYWIYNEELGLDIIHANGPSKGLNPLPEGAGEYKNIAEDALISCKDAEPGQTGLLSDGLVVFHDYDDGLMFRTGGPMRISLKFDAPRAVRAVMVYNSINFDEAFDRLDVEVVTEEGYRYKADDVPYPADYRDGFSVRPGGSAVVAFNELSLSEIVVTIDSRFEEAVGNAFAISEIVVLGK